MGIFNFGLFPGGRMTTDDTEELIHIKEMVDGPDRSRELQVRMRSSHLAEVENDINIKRRELYDAKRDLAQVRRELASAQLELDCVNEVTKKYVVDYYYLNYILFDLGYDVEQIDAMIDAMALRVKADKDRMSAINKEYFDQLEKARSRKKQQEHSQQT